jgi:hypothetical protein
MARPLTRAQALENRVFLKALRRCGNVRLACRELGLKYGTMQHRKRVHPGLALRWDAALVFAQAGFERVERRGPSTALRAVPLPQEPGGGSFRTAGGEMVICRRNDGRLQMRRAQPGKLTRETEQAFLAAVAASCNMSLAAAAVGSCFNAFKRRRDTDPAFARELRLARARGYERLEMALHEAGLAASHEHDDWRRNDLPAMPPMTVNQALQLMHLHQKEARLLSEPERIRRRRGESEQAHSERLAQMAEERDRRAREEFELAEAERWAQGLPAWGPAGEEARRRLGLPDLAQVTGWSRADARKAPHDESRALFGGWRIEEMRQKSPSAGKRLRKLKRANPSDVTRFTRVTAPPPLNLHSMVPLPVPGRS